MQRRSLLLTGPRQLAWATETLPELRPDEILIETSAGAISIGSELPIYCGTARSSAPARYPRMTGYESVGWVRACGAAVQRFRFGDRAVAFYGHRTAGIAAEARAIKVPEDISDALALLAILTCDVAKGVRKLRPQYEESALITGAGAIGLLTVFMLTALGARAVDVVEPRAERRERALRLGARSAVSPEALEGRAGEYAVGFECSSQSAAFALLQAQMQPGGRICVLADGNIAPLVLTPQFHEKELLVVGASDGWDYQAHAVWYFDSIRADSRGLEQVFDYRAPAADLGDLFERLASGTMAPVKVLVRYAGDDLPER